MVAKDLLHRRIPDIHFLIITLFRLEFYFYSHHTPTHRCIRKEKKR